MRELLCPLPNQRDIRCVHLRFLVPEHREGRLTRRRGGNHADVFTAEIAEGAAMASVMLLQQASATSAVSAVNHDQHATVFVTRCTGRIVRLTRPGSTRGSDAARCVPGSE